jgi:hypothetical protein
MALPRAVVIAGVLTVIGYASLSPAQPTSELIAIAGKWQCTITPRGGVLVNESDDT